MKGLGGLRPLEMGQSAAKAVTDNFIKPNAKAVVSQITGKTFGSTHPTPPLSGRDQNGAGDFGKLLEQNQSQQTPTGNPTQQNTPRISREAEFQEQNQQDQTKLSAARNELQKLEQEMAEIKRKREEGWLEQNKEEEEEKKMEELQVDEQNKQPVRAGSPNPEGGKKKG